MKINLPGRRVASSLLLASCLCGALSAATLHVSPAGLDDPSRGSAAAPLATIAYAAGRAAPGDTIQLTSGTFVVPSTVTIDRPLTLRGAGRNDAPGVPRTVVQAGYTEPHLVGTTDYGTPILRLTNAATGAVIEGIEFDGNSRQAGGAIATDSGVQALVIRECDFLRFHSSAVLLRNVTNANVGHCVFENSGAENSDGSTGMLMVVGATDSEFHHLTFFSAENGLGSSGYGVKGRGLLRRSKFHHITTDLKVTQAWAAKGSPNFGLEFWGNWNFESSGKLAERCEEVEVYNCTFRNTVSFAMQIVSTPSGVPYTVRFHHNVVDPKGWYGVEVAMRELIVDWNHFKQADSPLHNFVGATRETLALRVEHNLAENVRNRFLCVEGQIDGMHIRNNTVYLTPRAHADERRDFVVFGNSQAPGQNVTLHNNVVVAAPGAGNAANFYRGVNIPIGLLAYGAVGSNVVFPPEASYAQAGLFDRIAGDPELELTGARPAPYYQPRAVSVSRDSGFAWWTGPALNVLGLAPERGAIEHGHDYLEIFPNTTGGNQPTVTVGWTAFASTHANALGATVQDVSGSNHAAAVSSLAGPAGGVPLNSAPSANVDAGFVWTGGSSCKEALVCSGEHYGPGADRLDFTEVTGLTWLAGNGSAAIAQRAAVKVAGAWYVAETAFSTPGMTATDFAGQAVSHALDAQATAWRRLSFTPGSTGFQFAPTTTAAGTIVGEVEAVGVYIVNAGSTGGNSRFDRLALTATFRPGLLP